MKKPSVYLAGPITGLSYEGCTDWRQYLKGMLAPEIVAFSPLRAKEYLANEKSIGDMYEQFVLSTQQGIYTRDFFDCRNCDIIVVNFLGATRVSIGTVMEIAWAGALGKPVVLVMEKEGNVHDHSMIRQACPWRVESLDDALFVIKAVLLP